MHRARSSLGPGRPAAHSRPRGRVGLTLLELLMVLTLLSLLLGAGVGVLSQLDVGRRAAAGAVQNLIRVAQNSSVSRRAPARVRLDRAAGLVEAEALVVVGTWHFEGGGTEGDFGLDGTSSGAELVDDGWIGQALGFARASRGSYAQFPVHLDPAFDLSAGFSLAPNGQDPSHNRHWTHRSGVIVARHFDSRDTSPSTAPYGQRNRQ